MFYALFFIFMTFGRESETSFIRVNTNGARQKMESLLHGYLNTINRLSMQFPNHQIELQIEFNGVTKPPFVPIRRSNMRVVKNPKNIIRLDSKRSTDSTTTRTTTSTTTPTTTTATSTTVTTTTFPSFLSDDHFEAKQENPEKSPIYLEDLKKALDEFEKKLALHSNCNNAPQTTASSVKELMPSSLHGTNKSNHKINDILDLIGKGVKVQFDAPNPTDDNLHWLQIKIPKNQ